MATSPNNSSHGQVDLPMAETQAEDSVTPPPMAETQADDSGVKHMDMDDDPYAESPVLVAQSEGSVTPPPMAEDKKQLVADTPSPKRTKKTSKRKRDEEMRVQIVCTTGTTTTVFKGIASESDSKGNNNSIVQTVGMCRVLSGTTSLVAFFVGHPTLNSIDVLLDEKANTTINGQIFMTVTFGTPSSTFFPEISKSVFTDKVVASVPDVKRPKEKRQRKSSGPTSWNIEVNKIMEAQLAAGGKKDLRSAAKIASERRLAQKSGIPAKPMNLEKIAKPVKPVKPTKPISFGKKPFGKISPLGKPAVVSAPASSMSGVDMSTMLFGK